MDVTNQQFEITWRDAGKEPQCAPNPLFPDGIDLDVSQGQAVTCLAVLPYPARRIGAYVVRCRICALSVSCTTAGRPDDPRSITLPCKGDGCSVIDGSHRSSAMMREN
jgi:hypothetical protein